MKFDFDHLTQHINHTMGRFVLIREPVWADLSVFGCMEQAARELARSHSVCMMLLEYSPSAIHVEISHSTHIRKFDIAAFQRAKISEVREAILQHKWDVVFLDNLAQLQNNADISALEDTIDALARETGAAIIGYLPLRWDELTNNT